MEGESRKQEVWQSSGRVLGIIVSESCRQEAVAKEQEAVAEQRWVMGLV